MGDSLSEIVAMAVMPQGVEHVVTGMLCEVGPV